MHIEESTLTGVLLITPDRYEDNRGYFMELWQRVRYAKAGLPEKFVQDNCSFSRRNVLRGLHFQNPMPQSKLVSVLEGAVFDVAVDLRQDEDTFGQWFGAELSAENGRQMYVPEGLAHGFVVVSGTAVVHYKTTSFYVPDHDRVLRWDDPDIGISWPVKRPLLSGKDAAAPQLRDLPRDVLF